MNISSENHVQSSWRSLMSIFEMWNIVSVQSPGIFLILISQRLEWLLTITVYCSTGSVHAASVALFISITKLFTYHLNLTDTDLSKWFYFLYYFFPLTRSLETSTVKLVCGLFLLPTYRSWYSHACKLIALSPDLSLHFMQKNRGDRDTRHMTDTPFF